jgi:DNA-binding PadR family transcriptional regulator
MHSKVQIGGERMDVDISHFESEMNRGFLQVLVLVALEKAMYGYMMIKRFEKMGYIVEENTLYPLLRRLEKNSLIESKWDVSEGRPKKYYSILKEGKAVRSRLLKIWSEQDKILNKLAKEIKNV